MNEDRRVRRVLSSDEPRGDDLREAEAWIREVRSRLVHIRGELEDIGRIEARFPPDSLCRMASGTLTLVLIAIHQLVEGERSFGARAKREDDLWAQADADPDGFVVREGTDWDWRPLAIYPRGGGES